MAQIENIKQVVREFLDNASEDEIKEFQRLLKDRNSTGPGINIDIQKMAKSMAQSLHRQMGLTQETITSTARDMIIQLALKHQPDISERELKVLVNHMMPGQRYERIRRKIPKPVLKSMAIQVVLFATGRMSEEEKAELPDGWLEKYLNILPETVRKVLTAFFKEEIDEDQFLNMLDTAVNMK